VKHREVKKFYDAGGGRLITVGTVHPSWGIRNTHQVRLVMKSGELFDSAALLASVKGKLGPASEADEAWWKGRTRFAALPGWR